MPIFQDDIEDELVGPAQQTSTIFERSYSRLRRLSEESIRTELCEGPVPDSPAHPSTPKSDDEAATSSRAELIQRLKRGQSPNWIPNKHLESFLQNSGPISLDKPSRTSPDSSALLPSANITPERNKAPTLADARLQDGLNIERPRSALHTGDFTSDDSADDGRKSRQSNSSLGHGTVSIESRWFSTSPSRDFASFRFHKRAKSSEIPHSFRSEASPLSSLSSFAYQPPTSPLVQSEINEDVEITRPLGDIDLHPGTPSFPGRHMFSASQSPLASPSNRLFSNSRFTPQRREAYQAHQPRRSLTNANYLFQHAASPQGLSFNRSRRPSIGSDGSSLHHASMVGSYEESILRGRMSTTPSKPIDFLVQIGVLGKGKCKSSLRCPAHVTLPFPAVYYSYNSLSQGRSQLDDGPSPYVGQVDLENGLPNPEEELRAKRKAQSRYMERKTNEGENDMVLDVEEKDRDPRRTIRPKRRSGSPKAPPGGSYRIPEQGQLQIIIKNQNKTAVKLFLVPYDLTGMLPGTKTFIRQRAYSAGPIVDLPNVTTNDTMDRPILRYLIHLHICCPSKGRFYLYKSIRIVFANRVPDGKEKLRNETTWPEPRYSPYKPTRAMNPPLQASHGAAATLIADKVFRRRSLGPSFGGSSKSFNMMTTDRADAQIPIPEQQILPDASCFKPEILRPVDTAPLDLPPRDDDLRSGNAEDDSTHLDYAQPISPKGHAVPNQVWGAAQYEKLNKGDVGYGGNVFCISPSRGPGNGAEGLLSQRLRGLGVQPKSPR